MRMRRDWHAVGSMRASWIAGCVAWVFFVLLAGCATTKDPAGEHALLPVVHFPEPFQIIAHRGASAYAPENTMPAFERARELGAFEVELDVQLSRDGFVVLYHDSELAKKTGQEGRVADHSRDELLTFEIGTWFDETHPEIVEADLAYAGTKLITLAMLFERFGSELYYHIELKSLDKDLPRATLAAIEKAGLRGRVRITSFSFEQLERTASLDADLPFCLLIRDAETLFRLAEVAPEERHDLRLLELQRAEIDRALTAGFDQVGLPSHDLNRVIVSYAISQGLQIRAWRIKNDADMRRAIAVGAHGMTTNWPERLIQLMVEYRGSDGAQFIVAP